MEAVRPWIRLGAGATGAGAIITLSFLLLYMWPARKNFAWKRSAWLAGWLPLVGSGIGVAVGLALNLDLGPLLPGRIVETVIPLMAGLQAAYLLSPEDEPSLEVLLACPRPPSWLLLERLSVALLLQALVALGGSLAAWSITGEDPALLLLRWIPPTLFMAGFGVWVTQVTRQGLMGVGLNLFLWTGLLLGGDLLLNRYPWLWPLHLYMQPSEYYLLNRVSLSLLGLALLALALNRTRDEQRLLFGRLS